MTDKKILIKIGKIAVLLALAWVIVLTTWFVASRIAFSDEFEGYDSKEKEIVAELNELSQRLIDGNLTDSVSKNYAQKSKFTFMPQKSLEKSISFKVSDTRVDLSVWASGAENIKKVTMQFVKTDASSAELNEAYDEEIMTVLTVIDKYYKTDKFQLSRELYNVEYLLSESESDGTGSYSFSPHDCFYESLVGYEKETTYSYKLTKADSKHELVATVEFSIH